MKAGLVASIQPVWLVDAERFRIVWANPHALELWAAKDPEELYAREILAGAPAAVLARVGELVERARAGEVMREEWIMYPRGKKTPIMREVSPVRLPEGGLGLLYQARRLDNVDEALERDIAMFRHSVVIAALIGADGRVLAQNPTAKAAFGLRDRWAEWFHDLAQAEELLATTLADEAGEALARVRLIGDELRWHLISTKVIRDPVSGELSSLVEHVDVTEQVEAQDLASSRGQQLAALNATLALVERQRREIMLLSAPLLEVGRGRLAVPLTGRLDAERSAVLSEKLCAHVCARGVAWVILDLTGLAELDARAARSIEEIVSALALLGAQTLLSGVRPALARELARAGSALAVRGFHRSLAAAIEAGRARS